MSKLGRREFLMASTAAALAATSGMGAVQAAPAKPKKALQLGMLPKNLSDADKFKLAKACGFEGIEGGPIADLDAAAKLGEAARAAGTPIHSIVYGGWDAPLNHPDPAIQEKGVKALGDALRSAKAQGAEVVLLVPGKVEADKPYDKAWELSQANIRKVLPLAEELKVVIAVEYVWNNFLLSPLEFVRYVDEFKSPWLQAYFDTGNVVASGWPEQWIRILGKRTARIHLKDFTRKNREWKNLRDGDVNWPEVCKAMQEVGYASFVTPELEGGDEKYLRDLSARIDLILDGK